MIVLSILCAGCLVQGVADSTRDSTRAPAPFRTPSQFSLSGARLRALPVDDPAPALVLVPGVVLRGGEIGIDQLPRLSIRGAPPGEAAVYVDRAPVRFQLLGTTGIPLSTDAVDAVTVSTGVAGAALPDARGGVIDYVTRGGGERFEASLHAGTDEPFGSGSSIGYNHFAAFLGGPLHAVPGLTWAVSATAQGQGSPYRGFGIADQPAFVVSGVDTTISGATLPAFAQSSGLRRPMDWATLVRGHAKVAYAMPSGGNASLTVLAGGLQQRFFPGQNIGDPALYGGLHSWTRLGIVNWRQPVGHVAGGALTVRANAALGTDRMVTGPLTGATEADTRDPALALYWGALDFAGSDLIPLPITDQIIRNIRTNSGLRIPYINRPDLRNAQPFRTNPYGSSFGWPTQGLDAGLTYASERRVDGAARVEWTPGTMHHLTVGADVQRTRVTFYQADLINQTGLDAFVQEPGRFGVFVADQLISGSVSAEVGLRYDRFTSDGRYATTPGRIFTNPAWNPAAASDDTAYANSLDRVSTAGTPQSLVTPRLQLAAAAGAATTLHLGYAERPVPPTWRTLYDHINSDASFASIVRLVFARDVAFARSRMIEAGVRRAFGSAVVDVTAHHETALRPYETALVNFNDPANPGRTIAALVGTSTAGGAGTGLDASLQWQHGTVLDGVVAYSYLRATHDSEAPVVTHAIAATLGLRVPADWRAGTWLGDLTREVQLTLFARAASGLPYTRLEPFGTLMLASDEQQRSHAELQFLPLTQRVNASRLPWTKTVDLRVTKGVRTAGGSWTVFADFRNLLGFGNTIDTYAETGTDANAVAYEAMRLGFTGDAQSEASLNSALLPGNTVDLRSCGTWTANASAAMNCVALSRVERRFGNGDGLYTQTEQDHAFKTYFDSFFGAWRFRGPGRTVRVGMELRF